MSADLGIAIQAVWPIGGMNPSASGAAYDFFLVWLALPILLVMWAYAAWRMGTRPHKLDEIDLDVSCCLPLMTASDLPADHVSSLLSLPLRLVAVLGTLRPKCKRTAQNAGMLLGTNDCTAFSSPTSRTVATLSLCFCRGSRRFNRCALDAPSCLIGLDCMHADKS